MHPYAVTSWSISRWPWPPKPSTPPLLLNPQPSPKRLRCFFPSSAWCLYESRSLLLSVQTTNNRKQQMVGLGLYNFIWFWKLLVHWLYWKTVWPLVISGIWGALLNPFTTEKNMIPDSPTSLVCVPGSINSLHRGWDKLTSSHLKNDGKSLISWVYNETPTELGWWVYPLWK